MPTIVFRHLVAPRTALVRSLNYRLFPRQLPADTPIGPVVECSLYADGAGPWMVRLQFFRYCDRIVGQPKVEFLPIPAP